MFRGYCIIEVCISLFFVLTSGRPLPGTTFFVLKFEATLQPLSSADRDSGIFCTAATALFIAVKGLSPVHLNLNIDNPNYDFAILLLYLQR